LLDDQWSKTDSICVLLGDEVSGEARNAFEAGLVDMRKRR